MMKDYFADLELPGTTSLSSTRHGEPIVQQYSFEAVQSFGPGEAELLTQAAALAQTAVQCFTAYKTCQQQEETKRTAIAASLKQSLAQIQAMKELHQEALTSAFRQQDRLLEAAAETIKLASERGDHQMLLDTYNWTLEIYYHLPGGVSGQLPFMGLNEPSGI